MSEENRAKELAERFTAYHNEVIACVENCSEEDWSKTCPYEGWTVGVVARHIAVHYGIVGWVKKIAAGEELPERNWDVVKAWQPLSHDMVAVPRRFMGWRNESVSWPNSSASLTARRTGPPLGR